MFILLSVLFCQYFVFPHPVYSPFKNNLVKIDASGNVKETIMQDQIANLAFKISLDQNIKDYRKLSGVSDC